jgi:predicted nucleic acid-binding protein
LKDHAFVDTSALLKLYLSELGSGWLQNFIVNQQIVASELIIFEATVTVRRRYIEGSLTLIEATDILRRLNKDAVNYSLIPIAVNTLANELETLIFALPNTDRIRTLDAIHLTSAIAAFNALQAVTPAVKFTFISADLQLLRIAAGLKLATENPESHP